ncbi:MAG: hypothetical protein F4Y14_14290, partial [Acidobacteria bacterium]|nr:hypothetical protein [Acidobacteriota bacterium]
LLYRLGYRLQSVGKRQEGATYPDRNAQFEHINQTADDCGRVSDRRPACDLGQHEEEGAGSGTSRTAGGNGGEYPTGVTLTKEQMDALALVRDAFHGERNYKLLSR